MRLPTLFVNYLWNSRRESPINVGAARVVFGLYLVWNVASIDFGGLADWHVHLPGTEAYQFFQPLWLQRLLPVEQAVAVAFLLAFVVGYRQRVTALVSALLVAHLTTVMSLYSYTGRINSLFISVYILLFFGLYAETDHLTLDTLRGSSRGELRRRLQNPSSVFSMRILQLTLLAVAVLYFGSAWAKLFLHSPGIAWEWLSAGNLGRYTISSLQYWEPPTRLGSLMLQYPALLSLSAIGTVVLELGLLVVALLGLPITAVVLGLLGMHTIIALALGPFFFDQYVFLALLVPWDSLYKRVAPTTDTTVTYDDRSVVVGLVYVLELLDTNDVVTPVAADLGTALHLADDGVEYGGFFALRELLSRYPLFAPLAWLLARSPLDALGTRAYQTWVDTHGRCFVRDVGRVDEDGPSGQV